MSELSEDKEKVFSERCRNYAREYYRKNKERINQLRKKNFENPEKREKRRKYDTEWHREYRKNHREKINAYQNEMYHKYKNNYLKRQKQYYYTHTKQRREYGKKRYNLNKIKLNFQHKERIQDLKFTVMAIYCEGNPFCQCPNCNEGQIEFLTIDHILGGGNKHRKEIGIKGGADIYYWLIKNNFPEGFRVLCWNCNMARGKFDYCPHELISNI